MKLGFWGAALLCLALLVVLMPLHPAIVWAATTLSTTQPTTVTIGWGDYVTQLVQVAALVLLAFLMSLVKRAGAYINTSLADQLLTKAVQWGINAVDGAVAGKTLTVDVGQKVAAQALQYANDHGSGWLLKWLGGPVAIAQKIWARLPLEQGASTTTVDFNQLAAALNSPATSAKPA